MNTGFTETERIIIVLAELLYCLAYTYAAWLFMEHEADRAEADPAHHPYSDGFDFILKFGFNTQAGKRAALCGVRYADSLRPVIAVLPSDPRREIVETILFAMAVIWKLSGIYDAA